MGLPAQILSTPEAGVEVDLMYGHSRAYNDRPSPPV